jgi:hypothetical protein
MSATESSLLSFRAGMLAYTTVLRRITELRQDASEKKWAQLRKGVCLKTMTGWCACHIVTRGVVSPEIIKNMCTGAQVNARRAGNTGSELHMYLWARTHMEDSDWVRGVRGYGKSLAPTRFGFALPGLGEVGDPIITCMLPSTTCVKLDSEGALLGSQMLHCLTPERSGELVVFAVQDDSPLLAAMNHMASLQRVVDDSYRRILSLRVLLGTATKDLLVFKAMTETAHLVTMPLLGGKEVLLLERVLPRESLALLLGRTREATARVLNPEKEGDDDRVKTLDGGGVCVILRKKSVRIIVAVDTEVYQDAGLDSHVAHLLYEWWRENAEEVRETAEALVKILWTQE